MIVALFERSNPTNQVIELHQKFNAVDPNQHYNDIIRQSKRGDATKGRTQTPFKKRRRDVVFRKTCRHPS